MQKDKTLDMRSTEKKTRHLDCDVKLRNVGMLGRSAVFGFTYCILDVVSGAETVVLSLYEAEKKFQYGKK